MANCREAAEPSDSDKVGGVFHSCWRKIQKPLWKATNHGIVCYKALDGGILF